MEIRVDDAQSGDIIKPSASGTTPAQRLASKPPVALSNIRFFGGSLNTVKSNRSYTLQFGSYKTIKEVEEAVGALLEAGVYPSVERYKDFNRVTVLNVKGSDVRETVRRAGLVGFGEVWLR
jgi:cell division protein FtsN